MSQPFVVEPLGRQHDRKTFSCGVEALDRYLHQQASQDMRRRVATCFVAVHRESSAVAGFYTLAATSLVLNDLPEATIKKLPRYPAIPAILFGRLAVSAAFRGQGLGAALLADALDRAARVEIGAFALLVDAKDQAAGDFYRHHGFEALPDAPRRLFLALASAFKS
jgi:GNAT superfamily N-acetyltransferase